MGKNQPVEKIQESMGNISKTNESEIKIKTTKKESCKLRISTCNKKTPKWL